jgi:hypothetical protein
MTAAKVRREQVSVVLNAQERAELERVAQEQHRSLSNQIRHLLATALKNQGERATAA